MSFYFSTSEIPALQGITGTERRCVIGARLPNLLRMQVACLLFGTIAAVVVTELFVRVGIIAEYNLLQLVFGLGMLGASISNLYVVNCVIAPSFKSSADDN